VLTFFFSAAVELANLFIRSSNFFSLINHFILLSFLGGNIDRSSFASGWQVFGLARIKVLTHVLPGSGGHRILSKLTH
jgi:hypothetical protein